MRFQSVPRQEILEASRNKIGDERVHFTGSFGALAGYSELISAVGITPHRRAFGVFLYKDVSAR